MQSVGVGEVRHRVLPSFASWNVARIAVFASAWFMAAILWIALDTRVAQWPAWVGLIGALIAANYVSLPLDRIDTKARVWFSSVPCFLIVAFFSPAQAMVLMGVGMTLKEVAVCRRCGNNAYQIAGQAGRWMFIALFASVFVTTLVHQTNVLFWGAVLCVLLWAADVVTAPLVVSLGTIRQTISTLASHTWADELMQYLAAYFLALPLFFRNDYMSGLVIALTSFLLVVLWMILYVELRTEEFSEPTGDGVADVNFEA